MPVVRTLKFNAEEYSFTPRNLVSWMIDGSKNHETLTTAKCKMDFDWVVAHLVLTNQKLAFFMYQMALWVLVTKNMADHPKQFWNVILLTSFESGF